MGITLYHNPACSTSRNVLALLRDAGKEPVIIEYLKSPPTHAELVRIIRLMGVPVRDIIRSKESIYQELGLNGSQWTEEQLIDMMVKHPVLINRPIVITGNAARLCRPADTVRELL